MSTALFEVLWKLITGSWILVAFRRGWGASSTDPPTREELAAEEASQRRSAAEVGASPTDRDLARALIRSSEMPHGLSESWRGWSPLDPSDPIVVSAQQSLASKQGRFRRRAPTQRILLELRRYWNEEAASEAMAAPTAHEMPDGGRMRERARGEDEEIRIFEWSRREDWKTVESMLELRLRRGSALAILLATSDAPTPEWERQTIELMRGVGERLR